MSFKCFVLNALCSKAKQLRILLKRHGIRPDFLEIHLLLVLMERYFRVWNHVEIADTWIKYFATWFKAIAHMGSAHIAFLELHINKFCCCPCEILGWLEKVDLHCLKVWRSWMNAAVWETSTFLSGREDFTAAAANWNL